MSPYRQFFIVGVPKNTTKTLAGSAAVRGFCQALSGPPLKAERTHAEAPTVLIITSNVVS